MVLLLPDGLIIDKMGIDDLLVDKLELSRNDWYCAGTPLKN